MEDKVLQFTKNADIYRELANKNAEKGEYERAISYLFSALSCCENPCEIYGDIAETYTSMGLYEKATEYWFKFLDTAPEDEKGEAFEGLALNFFYQDKLFEAGYYLHKKILKDGYVSREGLGEDIAELMFSETQNREAYHIAYPYNCADYSYEKRLAKKAFSMGDFNSAIGMFDKIPNECMDEEAFGDKAVAYFLQDKDEETVKTCKKSIEINGENLTAYCNLCTYYYSKSNLEKSQYYYSKLLSLFDKSTSQSYQVASCAIEQNDHQTVNFCLSNIVKERQYDITMRLYFAISYANLSNYESALREFSYALKLNPLDRVIKYYVNLMKSVIEGDKKALDMLPLKYNKDYPEKLAKEYKSFIGDLISEKVDLGTLKKKGLDSLYWGIFCNEEEVNKECAILLWFAKNVGGQKILTELLMDIELRPGVKRVIIYTLLMFGYSKPFGVIAGNRYKKIKKAKLEFSNEQGKEKFVHAYATIMARTAFWEMEEDKKLVKALNMLYKEYKQIIEDIELSVEEIAVVCICTADIEELKNQEEIARLFNIKLSRVNDLIKLIRGEKIGE